ncbi:hypothetical protein AB9U01_25140 [Pseudomonas qingdaonensis]|uniref:hypothetical protein n=1 Tax=Pseudomonas qingdaonensis TaxID=2056231 RepID=UPI0035184A7B
MNPDLFPDSLASADALEQARIKSLQHQLIRLGDMLGDGLGDEPGGAWIKREYRAVAQALGHVPPRKRDVSRTNARVAEALQRMPCPGCGGMLQQTRSGALRAKCPRCAKTYQLTTQRKEPHR